MKVDRRVWLRKAVGSGVAFCTPSAWTQKRLRTVGYIGPPGLDGSSELLDQLRVELQRLGWDEGTNVRYEARRPGAMDPTATEAQRLERPTGLARDLAAANVDVIVAMSTSNALAAKRAGLAIPVVFLAEKPVENGLVSSLAKPSGNLTGMTYHIELLITKRLQLLTQAAPGLARVGYLSVNYAEADAFFKAAAEALHLKPELVVIEKASDLERIATTIPAPDGWLIDDYTLLTDQMKRVIELIARTRKPAIFSDAEWVRAGGFMSYSDDRNDIMRYVARYVDRILRGARPADLPVEQPSKFRLTLNMKTARALPLKIPSSLMLLADEVIE
jgi:putative ABC transport system substrate-binding protein